MRSPYTQLYLHLVWSTWDRLPLIDDDLHQPVHAAITAKCIESGCQLLAIGGTADHVHLLVRLKPAVPVAGLVKDIKGSSSHLVIHILRAGQFFKWQGAYGAFTIRKTEVEPIRAYIANQAAHHAAQSLDAELETSEVVIS